MPTTPKQEGFLNRWSRVKSEGAPEAASEPPQGPPDAGEALSDAEILEKLGLPDPAALQHGDDVRGFLSSEVPEHLRRLALRFLWRSNPLLANVDGLVDYGEDFTDAATVVAKLQTTYEVGRGAAWKFRAAQEAEAAHAEEPDVQRTIADAAGATPAPDSPPQPDTPAETEESQPVELAEANSSAEAPPMPARPRPMQFEFD